MLFAEVSTHTFHAGVMGIVCGSLHAFGPDHLATLAAFSTLLEPCAAARVGAAWGLGHCAGVAGVAVLVFLAGRLPFVNFESWERNGDYVIGVSMILVALYFIFREEHYVVLDGRGQVTVKGCGCCSQPHVLEEARHQSTVGAGHKDCHDHGHSHGHDEHDEHGEHGDHCPASEIQGVCGSYSAGCSHNCKDQACGHRLGSAIRDVEETTPLLPKEDATQGRDLKGAVVGLVQGMCCPMGLIQLGYLAGRNAADTVVFVVVTTVVSVCGTAMVAAAWAALTRSSITKVVSPRLMYRMSCGLALALGILWITANYLDILDKFNYAEHSSEGMQMH